MISRVPSAFPDEAEASFMVPLLVHPWIWLGMRAGYVTTAPALKCSRGGRGGVGDVVYKDTDMGLLLQPTGRDNSLGNGIFLFAHCSNCFILCPSGNLNGSYMISCPLFSFLGYAVRLE